MRTMRWWLLGAALVTGTWSDRVTRRAPLVVGGYRVLAADFHLHTFPLSASSLAPWDLVLEARRQGLDAIAITGHNEALSGRAAHWFSRAVGGPVAISGEEIHGPEYHLIALGIRRTMSWRLSAAQAIAEVHGQGGVAIAAHPVRSHWKAFEGGAAQMLDGAEVWQPVGYLNQRNARDLFAFSQRSGAAAIASSDWHGMGPVGVCRTYLFAKDDSEAAILDAIRARRTVVVDGGRVFGNLDLARAAGDRLGSERPVRGWLAWVSAICGVAGLLLLALTFRAPACAGPTGRAEALPCPESGTETR